MNTDPIAAARALIAEADNPRVHGLLMTARDLRDMVATLADALEAERAKVAAAFKAGIKRGVAHAAGHTCEDEGCPHYGTHHSHPSDLETLADAQAALDKMLAEARMEGWQAGRDAAAGEAMRSAEGWFIESEAADLANNVKLSAYYGNRQTAAEWIATSIRALPEPKETRHDEST